MTMFLSSVESSPLDRLKLFTLHSLAYMFILSQIRLLRKAFGHAAITTEVFTHESLAVYHVLLADMLFADFIL